MRLLLDTHIFIWVCESDSRLRDTERDLIRTSGVVVSAVSAWEIAIKHAAGQLQFPVQRYNDIMEDFGFDSLDVTPTHGLAAGALPRHHKDPFDRMLIAQCLLEGLVLVSHDPWMRAYDVPVLGS